VARLATVGENGSPHLVPVTFAVDDDTVVTAVDRKPKTTTDLRRLRHIRANPRVCLLVDHYEDDWTRLWWVRADGRAAIVDDADERASAVEPLIGKYAQYRDQPPTGPAILIQIDRWSGWSYV
jgi:PPOX class probable F420-dependent enzyme